MSTTTLPSRYSPERLRQLLDASPLSRRDLARELGVSRNHIFQLLSGRRRINERMARSIAYTLDIDLHELMEDGRA